MNTLPGTPVLCFIFRAQKGNSLDILWYFFGLFTKYFIEKKIIFENKLLAVFPMSFRGPCDAWPNELKEMYLTVMYLLLPPWPSAGQIWYEYAKWRIVLYSYRIIFSGRILNIFWIYLNMFLTPKSRRIWHKSTWNILELIFLANISPPEQPQISMRTKTGSILWSMSGSTYFDWWNSVILIRSGRCCNLQTHTGVSDAIRHPLSVHG